jgi:hypothetical protein
VDQDNEHLLPGFVRNGNPRLRFAATVVAVVALTLLAVKVLGGFGSSPSPYNQVCWGTVTNEQTSTPETVWYPCTNRAQTTPVDGGP